MFREMRRNKQALSTEKCIQILEKGTSGVLAVSGDDDYPYAVPLSYVYDKQSEKIYFHCAKSGHKLDAIQRNCKASFCVIDQDTIVPKEYTTYYRSVIVFGTMHILENETQFFASAEKLALKYAPNDSAKRRETTISEAIPRLCMLEMQIDHMTGKEAVELKNK